MSACSMFTSWTGKSVSELESKSCICSRAQAEYQLSRKDRTIQNTVPCVPRSGSTHEEKMNWDNE